MLFCIFINGHSRGNIYICKIIIQHISHEIYCTNCVVLQLGASKHYVGTKRLSAEAASSSQSGK